MTASVFDISDQEVQDLYDTLCKMFPGMDTQVREMFSTNMGYLCEQRRLVQHNLMRGIIHVGMKSIVTSVKPSSPPTEILGERSSGIEPVSKTEYERRLPPE